MNIAIANRLVELRSAKGWTQEELAEKLDVSRQAVSKWERAESSPELDKLMALSRLYGISLDSLLAFRCFGWRASGSGSSPASIPDGILAISVVL